MGLRPKTTLGGMQVSPATLGAVRVLRALMGVFALIMLKASYQPGFEYFSEGDSNALVTFAWRFLVGVGALTAFLSVRSSINHAYVARGSAGSAPPLGLESVSVNCSYAT
jgi:hypothetical protein